MWTVGEEIEKSIKALALAPSAIRQCTPAEALSIVERAMHVFVRGNPRVWWLGLKLPFTSITYDQRTDSDRFDSLVPRSEKLCWFIPEAEEPFPIVYEAEISAVKAVLEECPFFEYNLVGKSIDWLMIETDHGQLIVADATHGS